jgi:uncharacterized protein YjiS (DUF1127 family)
LLARVAAGGIAALGAAWHGITDAFTRWRRAQRQQCEGEWLDERTLRDLGLDRSECTSYLAESSGIAAPTRRRVAAVRQPRQA